MDTISSTCSGFCSCKVCSKIAANIDKIFKVLEIYGWIIDSYIVDFFIDQLWEILPKSWTCFLQNITPEELGKWILKESDSNRVWPLSLMCLRELVGILEISRNHKQSESLKCLRNSDILNKKYCRNFDWPAEKDNNKNSEIEGFENIFRKHVKKKKRYEIDVLAKITSEAAKQAKCNRIVDIGAGMGHLARILTFKYGLNVICIEQDNTLSKEAAKCDMKVIESLSKHLSDLQTTRPQHVSFKVEFSENSENKLIQKLSSIFLEDYSNANSNDSYEFGIVGLHPCGDLAPSLLRFYSKEPKAKLICIVGCCYMKMAGRQNEGCREGYPMSKYVKNINGHELSYAALEVACHALEKHCDKLRNANYIDLAVHAYRAALEFLLVEKNSNLRRAHLRNVKLKENMKFKEYCTLSTQDLPFEDRPLDSDYDRKEVNAFLEQWEKVLIFGSLRQMIAPLIESIVLYDRFLYLSEHNLNPCLKAEFDARISPRNFILLSTKNNCLN